ncbi:uncharacterized protein LOC144619657 [Crassostrea virginica]
MEEEQRYADTLQSCLIKFQETVDYLIIKGHLIQERILTPSQIEKIEESPVRSERCLNLLTELIFYKPSDIKPFLKIVEKDYSFLVQFFNVKFAEKHGTVMKPMTLDIFTDYRRQHTVPLRHSLKLLSHQGKMTEFNAIINEWKTKWEKSLRKKSITVDQKQRLADMYFMTLDAQLEHRRVICDRSLVKDEQLFNEVKTLTITTSQPYLSFMMYLARHGSAKLLAGMPLDDSIQEVEEAQSHFDAIPPCRETGIVLYIYFNMLSSKYEKKPTESERTKLLELARKAIHHFGREDEQMGEDFKRMVLTKIALVNLGIGVYGNPIKEVHVSQENIKNAKEILVEIQQKYWGKLETRWKMFFFVARTRICEWNGEREEAFQSISKALKLSSKGKFKGELVNIQQTHNRLFIQKIIFGLFREKSYLLLICAIVVYFLYSFCFNSFYGDYSTF